MAKVYHQPRTFVREIQLKYTPQIPLKRCLKINTTEDAVRAFRSVWNTDTIELYEEFKVMYLNRQNLCLGILSVSKGGITGTVVDQKLVMATALKCAASVSILCHNHPFCNFNPSELDRIWVEKFRKTP